jgi:undecaprenyl-diphosphatase
MNWQWTHALDLWCLHQLNLWSGSWVVDRLISYTATDRILTGFVFLLPYWYYWFPNPNQGNATSDRRRLLLIGLLSGLVAIGLARGLAGLLPFRERPVFDASSGFARTEAPLPDLETWSSFPSDTAAFTFALSYGLRRAAPRLSIAFLAYAALVTGLFRVYLGIHYPSDSVTGALLGIAANRLCHIPPMLRAADRVARTAETQPQLFYPLAFLATAEMAELFDHVRRAGHAIHSLLLHTPLDGAVLLIAGALVVAVAVMVSLALSRKSRSHHTLSAAPGRPAATARAGLHKRVS